MTLHTFWNESWTAALVNHLWQSTLFVVIAWLLAWMLRDNQARTRYWIWMIASIKFLIPFSILITAGEFLRTSFATQIQSATLAAVMEQIAQPFPQAPPAAATTIFYDRSSIVAASPDSLFSLLLPLVWLCGFLIIVISWVRSWIRIRRAVHASPQVGLAGKTPILLSRHLLEPAAFGVFRPVLLLPEVLSDRLSESQFNAVIAHEMCHIRRRDNLSAAIHMFAQAAFWFHPALWWIKARLLDERERACDEAVLHSGTEAQLYAESILNVCKFCVESPLTCTPGVSGSDLKQRIRRIMTRQIARKLDFSRKLLLSVAGITVLVLPVVLGLVHIAYVHAQAPAENPAQDIAGAWQGTLHVGGDARIVVKISKADDGGYKTLFYFIDESGDPVAATKFALDGTTVRMSIARIGGNYEGKLTPDGKMITGNLNLGPGPSPLNLTRATAETEWNIPAPSPKMPPMDPNATPSFEVATIRPNRPDEHKGGNFNGNRCRITNVTLRELMTFAYGVQSNQIIGAPTWAGADTFDIEAKSEGQSVPSLKQWKGILQKLITDRFKLSFHRDRKKLSVYALSVGKTGPKVSKSGGSQNDGFCAIRRPGIGSLYCTNATMDDFTHVMQEAVLDKPVVDQTALEGRFDFDLNWTPDEWQFAPWRQMGVEIPPPPPVHGANEPPSLYTAIQQQTGLKLESTKALAEVLIIDHAEKPSEN